MLVHPAHPGKRRRHCSLTAQAVAGTRTWNVPNRRGCLSAISHVVVSLSRAAETMRGFPSSVFAHAPASYGRAAGRPAVTGPLGSPSRGWQQRQLVAGEGGRGVDSVSRGNISHSEAHTRLPTQPLLRGTLERVSRRC